MIKRICNPTKSNSFFLFGPRGAGKTTWLQSRYSEDEALYIDLLEPTTFDEYQLDITRFTALITAPENSEKVVIVDEIQKLPALLDIVHKHIQLHKRIFVLTGSSGRRLKQESTNLLAGRAWVYHFFPFSTFELGEKFNLTQCLERGSLPDAFLATNNEDSREYLNAYAGTYLQKEIEGERWVRNISPFRKFLAIAAQMNGKIVNKSKIAREVGLDDVTVSNYFEILEDTLIGFLLPSFHTSVRKAQVQAPKFYFIDPGIKRALDRTLTVSLLPQTKAWGDAFEHWIVLEFKKLINYFRLDWEMSFVRTKDDVEIDLVIDRPGERNILVEIKSKEKVVASDAKALESLGADLDPTAERWLLSRDSLQQTFGKTRAIYWRDAFIQFFPALSH